MSTTPADPDAPDDPTDPDGGEPRAAPRAAVPANSFILIALNAALLVIFLIVFRPQPVESAAPLTAPQPTWTVESVLTTAPDSGLTPLATASASTGGGGDIRRNPNPTAAPPPRPRRRPQRRPQFPPFQSLAGDAPLTDASADHQLFLLDPCLRISV